MTPAQPMPTPLMGFGEVRHTRLRPARNAFVYPTYFLMLPMRALRARGSDAVALNRRAALSFHDVDHGDGRASERGGALAWLDELLAAHRIHDATGEAWLHCYPRVLGYTFKPVSFWYCHTPDGVLRAIVVEVNNTFGERHCYLLDRPVYGAELKATKAFHVSPFCEVEGRYRFRFFVDADLDAHRGAHRPRRRRGPAAADQRERRTRADERGQRAARPVALPRHDLRADRAHPLAGRPALAQARALRRQAGAAHPFRFTRQPAAGESMTSTTTASRFSLPQDAPGAARTVLGLLQRLAYGSLTVRLPDDSVRHFGATPGSGPTASLTLRNWNACKAALKSGDIGFAESYIAGDWTTPNLTELLKVFIANRRAIEDVVYGSWFGRLLYRVRHVMNRNSKAGSSRNIHAHYDLGNAFYKLWLDETMNYSSAWFEGDLSRPMPEAQRAKVRRALELAGVQPGDRVLEIGCGWGALAEMAATDFGASVTGVTLSTEQLAFARQRTAGMGTDLRLQDYRDIADAPFDAICSIEMVEAVGREYWPTYFQSVSRLLKPGGAPACRAS
jgi:cyclopropane-fatty-acyl-phospholipid synthase